MRRYELPRSELLRLLDRIAGEGWLARTPGYGWRFAETLSSPEAYGADLGIPGRHRAGRIVGAGLSTGA